MNCYEAQQLLQAGTRPGGSHPQRAALGFHLANCPACRRYRARLDHAPEQMLTTMLARPALPKPVITPRVPAEHVLAEFLLNETLPSAKRKWPLRRYALLTLLALLLLIATLPVVRTALAVRTIRQNVQAMVVTPLPAGTGLSPTPQPTAPQPSPQRTATTAPSPAPIAPPMMASAPLLRVAHELAPPPGDAINVLLIGSDQRLGAQGSSRADAIMVARVDPQRQRVALLSLTRDLLVDIPGHGQGRINAANVYGGPELMRQTVSELLAIPIHHYAYVNFEGFITAVDALGGVTVQVDKELYQWGWELHFVPGPQHMDGLTALRYSRIRLPDSDYERIKRQQAVLLGIVNRVREQHGLESLQRLAELTTALRGSVQTDIPEERMIGLAWALRDFPLESVERYTLEGDMVATGVLPGDRYAQVLHPDTIATLTHQLLGPDAPSP